MARAPDALYDELITLTGITADAAILEIGPGTGKATLPLARRGYRISCMELGVELAAEATKNLEQQARAELTRVSREIRRLRAELAELEERRAKLGCDLGE